MIRILLKMVGILLVAVVGAAGGLTYGHYKLGIERQVHGTAVKELEKRMAQLQQKVMEERDRTLSFEGQKRSLQKEVSQARSQSEALSEELRASKSVAAGLEAKIEELSKAASSMNAANVAMASKEKQYLEVLQVAKSQEKAIKDLEAEKQAKEIELKAGKEQVDRCVASNAKLNSVAKEILAKYRDKRPLTSTLESEPFFQFKKVELEKIMQEYGDRIDESSLKRGKATPRN